jgi:hypothetical protein
LSNPPHTSPKRQRGAPSVFALLVLSAIVPAAIAGGPEEPETLTIQLVHPERQAARVLKLFEGARAPHPAAALAAWKRKAPHRADQLGKPLEAVIAFFNPDMATEWRVLDGTLLVVNWDEPHRRPRWFAIVPRDDGTLAAGLTASRLSEGADEPPLAHAGQQIAVTRLGRPGTPLAAHSGDMTILGTTPDELRRALERSARQPLEPFPAPGPNGRFDSGASFVLAPGRLPDGQSAPLPLRLTSEFLRGLSCRGLRGSLALDGACLGLEITTDLPEDALKRPPLWNRSASIDPSWLRLMPSSGAIAVVSLAFEPSPAYWDSAFALADRLEKTDPARAGLAPARTRLNLLTSASGARLEADLWPHLRGLTAGVFGEPSGPQGPPGGLLALHLDSDLAARRLVSQTLPRLKKLLPPGQDRNVTYWQSGHNVLVAWSEGILAAARAAAADPGLSVAPLSTTWAQAGKPAPSRLGVFWPARCFSLGSKPNAKGVGDHAAWTVAAEDPPAVWWGWNKENLASDSVQWQALDHRVHRFLGAIELEPPPAH